MTLKKIKNFFLRGEKAILGVGPAFTHLYYGASNNKLFFFRFFLGRFAKGEESRPQTHLFFFLTRPLQSGGSHKPSKKNTQIPIKKIYKI